MIPRNLPRGALWLSNSTSTYKLPSLTLPDKLRCISLMASSESESVESPSPGPSPTAASGRPKRSPVWNYFTYDTTTNMCQVVPKAEGPSPSMKKEHTSEYQEVVEMEENAKKTAHEKAKVKAAKAMGPCKQLTMSEAFDRNQVYDRSSERCRRITKKLAIFVGSTNSPNSIVENTEFRQFVATLDTRFPMPS